MTVPMSSVLTQLFDLLENNNILYCVLHDYQELPDKKTDSDIDICVSINEKRIDGIVAQLAQMCGLSIVTKLYYGIPYAFYYVLASDECQYIQLDFMNDPFAINSYGLKSTQILQDTRFYRGFRVPCPKVEAIYMLIKKVVKLRISDHQHARLKKLYKRNRDQVEELVRAHFGTANLNTFKKLLQENSETARAKLLQKLKKSYIRKQLLLKPWKWIFIVYYQTLRFIRRFLRPTGVFVCLIPAADDKETFEIGNGLAKNLFHFFRKTKYIHHNSNSFHNSVVKSTSKIPSRNGCRGNKSENNYLFSCAKWLCHWLSYILKYYFILLPMKVKTTAIITSSCRHNMIIHHIRYGFRLPSYLLRICEAITPKPDLVIYLESSAESDDQHRRDFHENEVGRASKHLDGTIASSLNSRTVINDKPYDCVVKEIAQAVLSCRATVTKKTERWLR